MVKNALGLIETVGLAAAVEAADAAIKAANVELIGYELSKGGGWVLIKIAGDVGAVKAAIDAAKAAASKVSKVQASHVIPRPHQELSSMLLSKDTVGRKAPEPAPVVEEVPVSAAETADKEEPVDQPVEATEEVVTEETLETLEAVEEVEEPETAEVLEETEETVLEEADAVDGEGKRSITCNICNDPACNRRKGDPKVTCMHYGKINKEGE